MSAAVAPGSFRNGNRISAHKAYGYRMSPQKSRNACARPNRSSQRFREEAPDHRRPVHRVQGRVVCRGRVPAARAMEPSRRRRRCREGGQEAGRSAGGGEEGTEGEREPAKASIGGVGEDAKKWRGNPLEVIGARAKALAVCMACRI